MVGAASDNRILMMAHEPLLQLLEPSLRAMMDKVRNRAHASSPRTAASLKPFASKDVDAARTWMTRHIRDYSKATRSPASTCGAGSGTERSAPGSSHVARRDPPLVDVEIVRMARYLAGLLRPSLRRFACKTRTISSLAPRAQLGVAMRQT